jgi:hypothetical protein
MRCTHSYSCAPPTPAPTLAPTPPTSAPTPQPTFAVGSIEVVVPTTVDGLTVATFTPGVQYAYRLTIASELSGTSVEDISISNIASARRRLLVSGRRLAGSFSFDTSITVASASSAAAMKIAVAAVPTAIITVKFKNSLQVVQTAGNFADMGSLNIAALTIIIAAGPPITALVTSAPTPAPPTRAPTQSPTPYPTRTPTRAPTWSPATYDDDSGGDADTLDLLQGVRTGSGSGSMEWSQMLGNDNDAPYHDSTLGTLAMVGILLAIVVAVVVAIVVQGRRRRQPQSNRAVLPAATDAAAAAAAAAAAVLNPMTNQNQMIAAVPHPNAVCV